MRRQPVIRPQPGPGPTGCVPARSRMRAADAWPLAVLGLASSPARAILSAVGLALGIATMVALLGISCSSRSLLVAEIDALVTNLLAVTPCQAFSRHSVS